MSVFNVALLVTKITPDAITLEWPPASDLSTIYTYALRRRNPLDSSANPTSWTPVTTITDTPPVSRTPFTYTDGGLAVGTERCYQYTANDGIQSETSNDSCAKTG